MAEFNLYYQSKKELSIREDMEIGLIGFGRFGQLSVKYLSRDFPVFVSSRTASGETIRSAGGEPASLEEVCRKDIVIPTVPISAFKATIQSIAPLLHRNLLVDACSVKEYPVEIMTQYVPEGTQILATHPMFGPDSAGESLAGQKIVLSRIRIDPERYRKIKTYLGELGLQVIETTPANHDRQIARSQVLTHFIGRGLSLFGARAVEIDTEGYKRLLTILEIVGNDTTQLFTDLNKYNRYAPETRKAFIRALTEIDRDLQ